MHFPDVAVKLLRVEKHLPGVGSFAYFSGMASVVCLTNRAPAKLIGDLMVAGHRAWGCVSVSEVLYFCERGMTLMITAQKHGKHS